MDAVSIIKKFGTTFLIYKEFRKGAGAKSYMRKGFPIHDEMREFLVIYEVAVSLI